MSVEGLENGIAATEIDFRKMNVQMKAQVLSSVQTLQELRPVVARLENHVVSYHEPDRRALD